MLLADPELTVAELLEGRDGGQRGDVHAALLQRLQRFGLPQEQPVELRLQRSQPAWGSTDTPTPIIQVREIHPILSGQTH